MKATTLRPELHTKIYNWLVSFHHLDPRYKILTFFNQVAREGADDMLEDDDASLEYDLEKEQTRYVQSLRSSSICKSTRGAEALLKDVFHSSSILTVWRPCSNDAMRKMMEGVGVGKGLDIKGKSAKQGLLSAFVPFMQIHQEEDKKMIQPISSKAYLRVYYSSKEARTYAISQLLPLVREKPRNNNNNNTPIDSTKSIKDDKFYVIPSTMKLINKYDDNQLYGMELSQRLFWEGYVKRQDISRDKDGTDTGRPSTAGFQDANLKTLKVACATQPNPSPMPVLFQYDPEHAMRPQTLLMAYEENGTVTPVVSDFDGFLMGWRREALWFGCNLPREQEELMMWCIDHIASILDERPSSDTWTVQWLEVLKKEASKGFIPQIPEYGFGDPKSYSIMEKAALRLIDTGAVRHGSECFNYYFPQEIDEYFLVVSDTFNPVPWKYVDVHELQSILSEKIEEGFVFPLNPKWILCDPGWKKLYDELMASDALYADLSKDVWFPPYSGVRERLDEIHKRHPRGFQRRQGRFSVELNEYSPLRTTLGRGDALSGNAAFDLAELELENFTSRKMKLAHQIRMASLEGEIMDDDSDDEDNDMNHQNETSVSERRRMFQMSHGERMQKSSSSSGNHHNISNGSLSLSPKSHSSSKESHSPMTRTQMLNSLHNSGMIGMRRNFTTLLEEDVSDIEGD